jgi:hypothetical protein
MATKIRTNLQTNQMLRVAARLGVSLALLSLSTACNYQGSSSEPSAPANAGGDDGGVLFIDPLAAGADGVAAFQGTVYPLLSANCAECHVNGPGSPSIAQPAVEAAYRAVVDSQKVNLATPASSRLVRRLVADFHYCWSDCVSNGFEMEQEIAAWAALVQASAVDAISVEDGVVSQSLRLADGVEDTGLERYNANQVALWEFKEGSGDVAFDTSGDEPPLDLVLSGDARFISSYGLEFEEGRASQGSAASRKLYDRIASPGDGTQQYSVEAWVVPANVTQEGPARIITYSKGTGRRNFTLGQTLYNYDFRNRSLALDVNENGTPTLSTYDGDQDLQDSLQHTVITYDQFRGRRIYVNATFTDDADEQGPGRLWNWDETMEFALGNETNDSRPWAGQIRLAAIYDHVLTDAQIQQNFNAGVGKRVLLRFDLSAFIGAGSYLEFTVSELDDYSYLLCKPTIVTPSPVGFRVHDLRIAVNGQVAVSGQAFTNIDATITSQKQELSRLCSVIAKDQGPLVDSFTVEFDVLGNFLSPPAEVVVYPLPPPPLVQDLPREGIRDFARANATMAALTGVDATSASVQSTYIELEQQLPSGFDLRAFSSSHQVGVAKLALEYCDALVESNQGRTDFFGTGFDFGDPTTVAFAGGAARDRIFVPLMDRMLGQNVANQPDAAEVRPLLDSLVDDLTAGCTAATCGGARTRTVVKAACAALLSSAAVSVH